MLVSVAASYDEAGQNVTSYNVYQSEADFSDVTGVTKIASVSAGTFSYRVTSLTDNIRYYFAVAPVNSDGLENPSVRTASAIPFVVDWDNDHKKDLMVGDGSGNLNLFINSGTDQLPAFEAPTVVMTDEAPLIVDGGNAAPCVLDWDADGKNDLLIGCKTGEVYLYINTGTDESPSFTTGAAIIAGDAHLSVGENSIPYCCGLE